jgi:hypothetical protein
MIWVLLLPLLLLARVSISSSSPEPMPRPLLHAYAGMVTPRAASHATSPDQHLKALPKQEL